MEAQSLRLKRHPNGEFIRPLAWLQMVKGRRVKGDSIQESEETYPH